MTLWRRLWDFWARLIALLRPRAERTTGDISWTSSDEPPGPGRTARPPQWHGPSPIDETERRRRGPPDLPPDPNGP